MAASAFTSFTASKTRSSTQARTALASLRENLAERNHHQAVQAWSPVSRGSTATAPRAVSIGTSYPNPVSGVGHGTTGTGGMGQLGEHGGAGMGGGQFQPAREDHKTGGILHRRSGSSSSSSSEDDGMGGRRKKGIKEKIKEKLPGGHKQDDQHATALGGAYGQGHTGGTNVTEGTGEKKGIMDKIKEKLPGQH